MKRWKMVLLWKSVYNDDRRKSQGVSEAIKIHPSVNMIVSVVLYPIWPMFAGTLTQNYNHDPWIKDLNKP